MIWISLSVNWRVAASPLGRSRKVGDAGRKANVVDADGNVISWIQVVNAGPVRAEPVE